MADAYGALTFSKSDDCVFDGKALTRALNELQWTTSGNEWKYYVDGDMIGMSDFGVQYPTVFPEKHVLIRCYCSESDIEYEKISLDMTEHDWLNFVDSDMDLCSLEDLRDAFSRYLSQGWFEIACCYNEKCRYVTFQSLRIYASGEVERVFVTSGPCTVSRTIHEQLGVKNSEISN
jgi:hypothetical protein